MQVILSKLILQENYDKIMVQQCFSSLKSNAKTILNFSLDSLNVTEQYAQWNIEKY